MKLAVNAILLPRSSFFLFNGLLLLFWAGIVLADAAARGSDPETISIGVWARVSSACVLGFLMSSAETIWVAFRETGVQAIGKFVQTLTAAFGAGLMAFGSAWITLPGQPMAWYLATLPAAFLGEKYMRKFVDNQAAAKDKP